MVQRRAQVQLAVEQDEDGPRVRSAEGLVPEEVVGAADVLAQLGVEGVADHACRAAVWAGDVGQDAQRHDHGEEPGDELVDGALHVAVGDLYHR